MGDAKNGPALVPNLEHLVDTLSLELLVANGQDLIDNQNLRVQVDGDGKGQPQHHSVGIGAQWFVDKVVQFREIEDCTVQILRLPPAKPKQRRVQRYVFPAGEIGVKARAEFQ